MTTLWCALGGWPSCAAALIGICPASQHESHTHTSNLTALHRLCFPHRTRVVERRHIAEVCCVVRRILDSTTLNSKRDTRELGSIRQHVGESPQRGTTHHVNTYDYWPPRRREPALVPRVPSVDPFARTSNSERRARRGRRRMTTHRRDHHTSLLLMYNSSTSLPLLPNFSALRRDADQNSGADRGRCQW